MAPHTHVGKYILKRKIGEGAFAEVRYAVHCETKAEYAVKVFDRAALPKAHFEQDIKKEIRIMQHLRHPNIVSIHSVLVTDKKLYLVMELVRGGELYDEIVSKTKVDEATSRRYFQQIVDAMVYCHRRGVVHRDLKPENLLLDGNGNVKITDFGMSWMKENIDPATKAKQLLRTQCGTPKYMPPEVIVRPAKGYDGEKLDAWECGMVLYALLAGYLPFSGEDDNTVFRSILNGKLKFPSHFSPGAKDILTRLLEKDPEKRSSLAEIRHHMWFLVNYEGDALQGQKFAEQKPAAQEENPDEKGTLAPNLASPSSCSGPAAKQEEDNKENRDPLQTPVRSAVVKKPGKLPIAATEDTPARKVANSPMRPLNTLDHAKPSPSNSGRPSLLAMSFSPRQRRSSGASDRRISASSDSATTPTSNTRTSAVATSPLTPLRAHGDAGTLLSPRARRAVASPRHSRLRTGHKGGMNSVLKTPLATSRMSSLAMEEEDTAPSSLRDRIRSPLANMFRSLRSGPNAEAVEDAEGVERKQTTWFAESSKSPTAVDAVGQEAHVREEVRRSKFSRSASSSEEDAAIPPDDYADDVPVPSTLDKMARVFKKPSRV